MENQETLNVQNASGVTETEYCEQMYRFMNIVLPSPTTKDTPDMKELQRRLKKFLVVMNAVSNHDWSAGIAEIQEAWGVYLLANRIDEKRVKRMNEAIGAHLQFLVQMAENRSTMKQLFGVLNKHYINVTNVMNRLEDRSKATSPPDEISR